MMPSWIGIKFANLGQNNQIPYKNWEKLENICSIYIWGSNGVKVCTGYYITLQNILAMMSGLICPKWNMFGENNQILCKNRKN